MIGCLKEGSGGSLLESVEKNALHSIARVENMPELSG
jgi:hypothetical protein